MKFSGRTCVCVSFVLACAAVTEAFAPAVRSGAATAFLQRPIFASGSRYAPLWSSSPDTEQSLEEEVEELVRAELAKTERASNLRNANGVEYAPWMRVSPEDEARIRAMMREKAAQRRARQLQERSVQGALLRDSQGQELSGVGLRSKVVDGDSVELEWATSSEASTRGFIVKRRPAKTSEFQVIASYETYGPLQSQGRDGGVYRYLDAEVGPGDWVYRVTESEANGNENDLSQCLVEIKTQEEQQVAVLGLAAFGAVAAAAVIAGFLLDPVQY